MKNDSILFVGLDTHKTNARLALTLWQNTYQQTSIHKAGSTASI